MQEISQKKAIQKITGPCVILAGAGTGKTHTIVEKIKYIINTNIYKPEKIVCLTFSNEAVNSLIKRVIHSNNQNEQPIIKTFHSFCADILKKHGSKIGIPKDFKILLPDDAKIILHKNFKITPYLCHKYINEIGIAKDIGISPKKIKSYLEEKNLPSKEELEKDLEDLNFQLQTAKLEKEEKTLLKEKISEFRKFLQLKKFLMAWEVYEKFKTLKKFQDYSDLNKNALELLKKYPEVIKEYDYIIVDEFQDTNKLQCDFLEKLAPHKNITVVGDQNQSIYRFRGAYKNNLDQFKKFFNVTEKEMFALDKSYRSTNKILRTAHRLIQNNYENKSECFPVYNVFEEEGKTVKVIELKNGKEEARKIVELIKEQISQGVQKEEICVMFRTHQQANTLKTLLDYEKIPYTSVTKKSLLKTSSIKTTINYLTLLDKIKNKSKGGEQAWWDLMFNAGFKKEDTILLGKFIKEHNQDPCLSLKILNDLEKISLSDEGKIKIRVLLKKIKDLLPIINEPTEKLILEIYNKIGLAEKTSKGEILNLQRFHEIVKEFSSTNSPDLPSLIYHLKIINNLGICIESPEREKSGIKIMTNHATKGLEYKTVIVANLAQKRFPMESFNNSIIPSELSPELKMPLKDLQNPEKKQAIKMFEQENQLLEERRLCYVAFTRAKKDLILTYSREYGSKKFLPSQFLNEIDYKKNPEISFHLDLDEKSQATKSIDPQSGNNINLIINSREPEKLLQNTEQKIPTFSPSSLKTFDECQKKYEYKYIYNMPDPEPTSWDAIKLGSFVHLVLEKGVQKNFKTEKELIALAKIIHLQENWEFIELKEAIPLIKIFLHRNKDKYSQNSLTEKTLYVKIDGLKFTGRADRIDFHPKGIEIIDYKTGTTPIKPKYRNWQLGFYALAAKTLGKPYKLTLDMLKKEKPLEFEIDSRGHATEINSERMSFNLEEVKQELLQTAKQIIKAHATEFKVCPPEKNCKFCSELPF